MGTITERVWHASQSWNYEHTYTLETRDGTVHKLRTSVRRNAYDEQSYARGSRWDGTKWHVVVSIPITLTPAEAISYVDRGVTASRFNDTATMIETEVAEIVA